MRREEKTELINGLTNKLGEFAHYYLADISGLNAKQTADLRRICFEKEINLIVVKNTLFGKALEQSGKQNDEIADILIGSTAVMFSNTGNGPAKLIKEFRKTYSSEKPLLKAAFVEECVYIGETSLTDLINLKSREELIGDIIALLQSPAKNVISALQASAGGKIAGLVKSLEEKSN